MTEEYKKEDVLRRLYWNEEMSLAEIGSKYGYTRGAVQNWMEKNNIPRRKPSKDKPGHVYFDERGYLRFQTKVNGVDKHVRIHRLVAIAQHGIKPVLDNVVHHKNNVSWDNRPSNLEVMTQSEHAKHHNS